MSAYCRSLITTRKPTSRKLTIKGLLDAEIPVLAPCMRIELGRFLG